MRIQEAITACHSAIRRYEKMIDDGVGKNIPHKIETCKLHLAKLREMELGGKSPWHTYGDIIEIYEVEDFHLF